MPGALAGWDRFADELSPEGPMPPVIAESWQRSKALGLDRSSQTATYPRLAESELRRRLEANADWLAIAGPHVAWLTTAFQQVRHVVFLTDCDGIVLHAVGDEAFIETFGLSPGHDWSEAAMGTNGAGTALAAGRPVAVVGPQHFISRFSDCTCTAAPIHGPDGTLIGAIDIRTAVIDGSPERLPVVAHAAYAVEREVAYERREASLTQSERSLRDDSNRLRRLADAMPQIVWVTRPDGWHEFYNARWYEYTGLTPEQSIGHGWNLPLHPEDRQRSIDRWTLACETAEPYEIEYRFRGHDGTYRWFLGRALPVRDESGAIHRWFGTCTDIDDHKRAEEQLRRNHDTFYHLIQHNPFGVYVVDADFRLRQVSAGSQKVFASVDPLLGRDFAEVLRIIWDEPFASEAISRFRHTLETGESFSAASTVERRADVGEVEAYDWRIERLTLPDGRFGVVCYFYDLSERQQWEAALRSSQERLMAALGASDTGTFRWCPATGEFLEFDENLKRLFGFAGDETVSITKSFIDRVHPEDRPALTAAVERSSRGADFEMEFRIVLPDGRLRWLYDRAKMMRDPDGRPAYLVGACTDITKRKETEDALVEADRRKDEFLATLAHELRNPLAPIRMGVELLRLGEDDPGSAHETLEMMEGQVRQMVRLIDDLLDVSRITRGKLELRKTRIDLKEVIRSAVASTRPLVEENRHTLSISLPREPLAVDGDPERLSQVFSNLLNNAAKYTPHDGRIFLSAQRQDSDAVVSVRDEGLGIPVEMLDQVFGMFTQVGRTLERSHGGLGIGLHLVQRLVGMHGGSVEARSAGEGQGSEFVVRLPLAISPAPPPDAGEGAGPAAEGRRVLVADDNRNAADLLSKVLSIMGHEVRTAYDGFEAVEAAEDFRPDVALLDIGMPKLTGYEVAQTLRREAWAAGITLVALTGWGQEEDRLRSKAAGFDAHLVKPVEPAKLQQLFAGLTKSSL